MALQHARSLLWRGEDLGSVGGNHRELIFAATVPAGGRAQIGTLGFASSVSISQYLASAYTYSVAGQNRIITNKSPDYWMTLTASMYISASSTLPISMPIAPLQSLFLPANMVGPAALAMNTTSPIALPPGVSGTAVVPQATASNVLTADVVVEI